MKEGAHRYKIELPDISKRDVDALVDELGLLGRVSVTPLAGGRNALIIMTHEGIDDIVAICSFVLDPDDLKIFEAPPLTPEQRAIEAAERARIEDEQGYGFFDPNEPDEGDRQPEKSDDERGYGFFQPIEQIRREAGIVAETPVQLVVSCASGAARGDRGGGREEGRQEGRRRRRTRKASRRSIRVSIEKVDQLINLVGELVITQAMLAQTSSTASIRCCTSACWHRHGRSSSATRATCRKRSCRSA